MERRQVTTDKAPTPAGAYSQGIVVNGFMFTAGLGPQDPYTGEIVGEDVGEQTRQVMRNLSTVLQAQGLSFADVVKATVHLVP